MTILGQPSSHDAAGREAELEQRIVQLGERERVLRSLLLDARDALVRARVTGGRADDREGAGAVDAPAGYADLTRRIHAVLRTVVPKGSFALVVSHGDAQLLEYGGSRTARHFPSTGDGEYAGHHPADSETAIAELEEQRRQGAGLLVFPATVLWWLDHYRELARHLESRYRRLSVDPKTSVVYDLREARGGETSKIEMEATGSATGSGLAPSRRRLVVVTIISRNYLSHARVLARTFLQQEPDGRFYLLVVDRLPEGVSAGPGVTVIEPEELDIPGFYEMCFKYGIVEFNTAVKPHLLSLLLEKYGESEVVYFDPDIMIMRPLDELREALTQGDIVLTPHIMRPLPSDGKRPTEQDIMISGAYNLGFIALRRSSETQEFLSWWQDRLQDGCRIDIAQGLFTDQKWIDLVPSLFPSTFVLRDPTYNVAFWNLHERSIARNGDGFSVNGRPAGFFHISGFDPLHPEKLSKHQNRIEVEPGSALAALLDRYARLLLDEGYEEARGWEYGYERFDTGIRVHPLLRQIYLNLSAEERSRFGDPFSTAGSDSFLEWATHPVPEEGNLSLFLRTLYNVRYDLQMTFPDVRGRDHAGFMKWARRWGSAEMGFEPELVRDEVVSPPASDTAAKSSQGAAGKPAPRKQAAPPEMGYEAVVERVQNIARATLPAGSRVLVISKGDYRLVDLGGSEGWHFPRTEEGIYGGFHPPNSAVAIAHLEALRDRGADYLLIPQPALWWLEYYDGFRRHLETGYRLVVQDYDSCLIYSLRQPRRRRPWSRFGASRWWQRFQRRQAPVATTTGA